MKAMLILLALLIPAVAQAKSHHARFHHSHHRIALHRHTHSGIRHYAAHPAPSGLVTVSTAANPITVASHLASKFQGFISDAVARGFHGPVHCFASGGHVTHSRHYAGAACDFAQTGWGRTVSMMYHVSDLARKWGLRDGCTFRDCGHIDDGQVTGGRRYASRHHRSYRAYAYARR